ncbi:MAG: hypothetical protein QF404_08680 [Planctomycetota bacterium]|nr:hypothetical protein [Planctomycetota bacterium]
MQQITWVEVTWQDITGHDAPWVSTEEAMSIQPTQMVSVGTILRERDEYLVIAGTVDVEGAYGNINAIPRGCIKAVKALGRDEQIPEGTGGGEGTKGFVEKI